MSMLQLGELPTGPWWPDLDRLLADIDHVLPEQAGGFGTSAAGGLIAASQPAS
jgi:hypothetical protein